ncbi:hypothetical protein [Polaromonas sp. C04]|uniref:hypothetical protein n=1 Tax=Polaromonas sp. C04 TaxID=1945857 RepID=UPI000987D620|nr:hypothetical protein [Polaromonas sp. C04]OOG53201.1 hypothetical protein B0E49_12125 [Polaromonas sp. C04]
MRMSDLARHRVIGTYLTLSMGCFGLYTLMLSLTPIIGMSNGLSSLHVGLLTAVLTGLGLFTDLPLAHIARQRGTRFIILSGTLCLSISCCLLYASAVGVNTRMNILLLVVATAVAAFGFSCLIAPLLGGIATQAKGAQVPVQVVNAIVQRIGAFAASLFIGYLFYTNELWMGACVALLISIMMIFLTRSLPLVLVQPSGNSANARQQFASIRGSISNGVKKSIYASASVQAYLVAGYAFFPTVMSANGLEGSVGSALTVREVVSISSVILVGTIFSRDSLSKYWVASAWVGALTLVAAPFMTDPLTAIVLFSIHGAALGIGIVLGNVHAYFGTTLETRAYGFASVVMSTRLTGVILPIVLGAALEVSVRAFSMTVLLYLMASAALYSAVRIMPAEAKPE